MSRPHAVIAGIQLFCRRKHIVSFSKALQQFDPNSAHSVIRMHLCLGDRHIPSFGGISKKVKRPRIDQTLQCKPLCIQLGQTRRGQTAYEVQTAGAAGSTASDAALTFSDLLGASWPRRRCRVASRGVRRPNRFAGEHVAMSCIERARFKSVMALTTPRFECHGDNSIDVDVDEGYEEKGRCNDEPLSLESSRIVLTFHSQRGIILTTI